MCKIRIHAEKISSSSSYNSYKTCISCIEYNHVDIYDKVSLSVGINAMFVPKRYSGEWTVNCGHLASKLIMIATLILALKLALPQSYLTHLLNPYYICLLYVLCFSCMLSLLDTISYLGPKCRFQVDPVVFTM